MFKNPDLDKDCDQLYIRLYDILNQKGGDDSAIPETTLAQFLQHILQHVRSHRHEVFVTAFRILAFLLTGDGVDFAKNGKDHEILRTCSDLLSSQDEYFRNVMVLYGVQGQNLDKAILVNLPRLLDGILVAAGTIHSVTGQTQLAMCLEKFQKQAPDGMGLYANKWLPLVYPHLFHYDQRLRELAVGVIRNEVSRRPQISLEIPCLCAKVGAFLCDQGISQCEKLIEDGQFNCASLGLAQCLLLMGPNVKKMKMTHTYDTVDASKKGPLLNVLLKLIEPLINRQMPEILIITLRNTWMAVSTILSLDPASMNKKVLSLLLKPLRHHFTRPSNSQVCLVCGEVWLHILLQFGAVVFKDADIFELCCSKVATEVLEASSKDPSLLLVISNFLGALIAPPSQQLVTSSSSTLLTLSEHIQKEEWFQEHESFLFDSLLLVHTRKFKTRA